MSSSETPRKKPRPPADEQERQGLAGEASADGRGGDEADRREEARHRIRVLHSVRDYLGSRNRRGKRRHAR